MRILCVCDEGNSRSPTIASLLRYRGHDTLAVGVRTAQPETLRMLTAWADKIIVTDEAQAPHLSGRTLGSLDVDLWPIADTYPRPFNPELRRLVLQLADQKGL